MSSTSVSAVFNELEGMLELKLARMQLRSYTFGNLRSNNSYQSLKSDIDDLTARVDACFIDLAATGSVDVDRVVGIKQDIGRLTPFLSDAHKDVGRCQQAAIEAMSPEALKMHSKIVNYITAIEYYYRDIMVRTLIPEYAEVASPQAGVIETYLGHMYLMRNQLLMGAEPDADMAENVGVNIRNTTRIMQALPSHISLAATVAIMRRIISVYNDKSRIIKSRPQKYNCCDMRHDLQEVHRADLRSVLYNTVDKQQPFTLVEAMHHIQRYMNIRSKVHHHCTKY